MSVKPARKRRPRHTSEPNPYANIIGCCALLISSLFLLLLWKTQAILDSIETKTDFRIPGLLKSLRTASVRHAFPAKGKSKYQPPSDLSNPPKRFLVFNSDLPGQGIGNIVSGLLSAHLLGLEFNRIVCTDYPTFFDVFEMAHPWMIQFCPQALARYRKFSGDTIELVNYAGSPDECHLKEKLSSDAEILVMYGNTYPRWPFVPDNFFFTYYRAKQRFLDYLPYNPQAPPKIVVHLRQPDGQSDLRQGLDEESFRALGQLLPSYTYLVTNRVEWYDYFESKYHWRHPNWNAVVHSATDQAWGVRGQEQHAPEIEVRDVNKTVQNYQMWADWYVMLTTDKVYHTHSDFSISAIHWMNIDSLSIQGMENGQLKLVNESWRVDGETAPLIDRTIDGEGTSMLRKCGGIF